MADVKISALPASTTPLAGTEVLPIVQSGTTVQVSVANLTAGRAIGATNATFTGALSVTPTWNNGATTFTGIGMNVTDTASAAGSLLLDLQVGGSSKFNVRKDGRVTFPVTTQVGTVSGAGDGEWFLQAVNRSIIGVSDLGLTLEATVGNSGFIGWSSNTTPTRAVRDLIIGRDAADTLAQRRSTNAQAFRLYNTYTDASNYERLNIVATGSSFELVVQNAGTGTTRSLQLKSGTGSGFFFGSSGAVQWQVNTSGHLITQADNTYDIGAPSATRPRHGYFAGDVMAGASRAFYWSGRASMDSATDSIIRLTNNAQTDFSRLQFGGTTNSFGAIARDGAGISIVGGAGGSTAHIKVPGVTVANLPAAATAGAGARAFVTDALAPVFGSAVAGSGAVNVPVYSDGAAWNVG